MHRSEKFRYKSKQTDWTSIRSNTRAKSLPIFKTSVLLILLSHPLFIQGAPIPSPGNNRLFVPIQRNVPTDQRQQHHAQDFVVSLPTLFLSFQGRILKVAHRRSN